MTNAPEITKMSFEKAYAELVHLIELMENGDLALEKSVELYERGRKLSAHCDQLLEQAELRIQQLNIDGDVIDLG